MSKSLLNGLMSRELKIGILMKGVSRWTGGAYYIRNLASSLRYLPQAERPTVALLVNYDTPKEYYLDLKDAFTSITAIAREGIPIHFLDYVLSKRLGTQTYWQFRRCIKESGASILFPVTIAPQMPLPVKWIGWIPDFQHIHLPEMFSDEELRRRTILFKRLADKAELLVFSSRNCEADFDKFYLHNNVRRKILSFCAILNSNVFERNVQVVKRKYHLPEKFLFLPNQFWKHKNHITAFKSIKILRDRGVDIKLYCSGSLKDYRGSEHIDMLIRYIKDNNLEDNIMIIGMLPRDDQLQIMRLATALVQPSLFEGWSTVIEEGKSLGKVMYVSDLPVNKEQNASGAIYFERKSAEDLANKIQSTWNELKPCPDLLAEEKLRYENPLRYEKFARAFLKVVEDV